MPLKKKNAEPKQERQMTQHAATVDGSASSASKDQLKRFEEAIRVFRTQKFREAREMFQNAATGPQKEISYNSRLHISMCDRRLEQPVVDLRTVDDHYNYAIERINARDLVIARHHLDIAQDMDGKADHVFYALALCCGLGGDLHGAYENLKHAIDLHPRNRLAARQDADFASLAHNAALQHLLYPEKPL